MSAQRKIQFYMHSPKDEATEKQLMQAGIQLLRFCGYTVLEVGQTRPRIRCVKCGTWSFAQGSNGSDKGVPDAFVFHPRWPRGVMHGQEWKRPKGDRKPEQVELSRIGAYDFVESLRDAVIDVMAFEERLGLAPNPRLASVLKNNP